MKTIYSDKHRLRDAKTELYGGELVAPFEKPSRADTVLSAVKKSGIGRVEEPESFSLDPVLRIHDAGFVSFLETAWAEWSKTGYSGEAVASVWPARRMQCRAPRFIEGKLGYYALAAETTITEGTWEAALASKDVALTGAKLLASGEHGVFSLCRPPGHHAARDMFGGYCFLNNAAIATQYLRDQGADRVAILDVDFHHGNGTQELLWDESRCLTFTSQQMPLWPGTGSKEEQGNFNNIVNIPLSPGSSGVLMREKYEMLVFPALQEFKPELILVSAGFDAHEADPLAELNWSTEDFSWLTERICKIASDCCGGRLVSTLEGGYDLEALADSVKAHVMRLCEA